MTLREWKYYSWLIKLIPKKVIYFCAMHVIVYASTGTHLRDKELPLITANEAISQYAMDNNIL